MKIFAILLFLLPILVAGQSKTDYENTMNKFRQFYNAGQGDSIHAMFGHLPGDMKSSKPLWSNDGNRSMLQKFGTLESFSFIGIDESDPEKVWVFKTVFSKAGAKTTSLTLYKDQTLGTFRFMTSSESITELLRKSGNSR